MVAPDGCIVLARRDLKALRREVRHDPLQELKLACASDLHASSMARKRRVAACGSGASLTALTTHIRRIPAAVSCATFDVSMPPMAKTGTACPSALTISATPLGPMTVF